MNFIMILKNNYVENIKLIIVLQIKKVYLLFIYFVALDFLKECFTKMLLYYDSEAELCRNTLNSNYDKPSKECFYLFLHFTILY